MLGLVSSEVHLVQKQLTQAENDNAALRTDKERLETRAGQLVRDAVTTCTSWVSSILQAQAPRATFSKLPKAFLGKLLT